MNEILTRVRTFRLSDSEYAALCVQAEHQHVTPSALVRQFLVEGLKRENFTLAIQQSNAERLAALTGGDSE